MNKDYVEELVQVAFEKYKEMAKVLNKLTIEDVRETVTGANGIEGPARKAIIRELNKHLEVIEEVTDLGYKDRYIAWLESKLNK